MISKIGSLGQFGGPLLVDRIVTNSASLAVSDSVRTVSGFAASGATGQRVLGHVESFIGQDGLSPVKDGTFLPNIGAVLVASATNQTVARVRVRVDIDNSSLYATDLSAAAGTTAGSNTAGRYFNLSVKDVMLESSVTETRLTLIEGTPNTMTIMQYYSHGLNTANTAQVVTNIVFSEVFGF